MAEKEPPNGEPECDLPQPLREIVRDWAEGKPILQRLNAYIATTFTAAEGTLDREDEKACKKIIGDVTRIVDLIKAVMMYEGSAVRLTSCKPQRSGYSFRARSDRTTWVYTGPYPPVVEVCFPDTAPA